MVGLSFTLLPICLIIDKHVCAITLQRAYVYVAIETRICIGRKQHQQFLILLEMENVNSYYSIKVVFVTYTAIQPSKADFCIS